MVFRIYSAINFLVILILSLHWWIHFQNWLERSVSWDRKVTDLKMMLKWMIKQSKIKKVNFLEMMKILTWWDGSHQNWIQLQMTCYWREENKNQIKIMIGKKSSINFMNLHLTNLMKWDIFHKYSKMSEGPMQDLWMWRSKNSWVCI